MPGGPPPQCSESGNHEGHQNSPLTLGVGLGSLSSTLSFDGSHEVDIEMNTSSLSGAWRLNDKWSLRGGLGIIRDGKLTPRGRITHNVLSGGMVAVGAEYLWQQGENAKPYIDFSVFISASSAEVENPITAETTSYLSSDLRLGGRASWIIKDKIFPYVTARVFAGPVSWELDGIDIIGSDIHHYQIALGSAIQFGKIGTFVEWAGLGENALSVGMSYAW